jgi:DNA-binding FadR family transcriptional regulator
MSKEDDTLSHLSQSIENGKWQVGERLPAERTLAADLGASRNTVRNALRVLEARGVVDIRRGSGCYLRSNTCGPQARDLDATTSTTPAHHALEAGFVLLPSIAALCARRISPEGLLYLEDKMIGLSQAIYSKNTQAIRLEISQFVECLAAETGNPVLEHIVRRMAADIHAVFNLFFSMADHEREDVFADLVKFLQALKKRDPAAARSRMEDRILRLSALFGKYLDTQCSAYLLGEMEEREIPL